jgi:hypothetical protein
MDARALLQVYRVLPNVVVERARGARPDVVKRFGVFDAVFPPEFAVASQEEFLDVIAVGRKVVVSQKRQALVFTGQLGAEP